MLETGSNFDEFEISVEEEAFFHSIVDELKPSAPTSTYPVEHVSVSCASTAFVATPTRMVSPKSLEANALIPLDQSLASPSNPSRRELPAEETPDEVADRLVEDGRSPLERFRTLPKKTLSVSDMISGQWCELQYYYTLTRMPFGRKPPTQAMMGGTKIHKRLEEEVHIPVVVNITSKEDGFGLRLWNVVQGLRTLRARGLTRELEVWGTIDGNIVNGIIDQVHFEQPDIQDGQSETDSSPPSSSAQALRSVPKIYITDVKTTNGKRKPSGPALRPTKMQLYLYHRLLSDIADSKLDLFKIFERYRVDPDVVFSDSYLAQLSLLYPEVLDEVVQTQELQVPSSSSELVETSTKNPSEPSENYLQYHTLRDMVPLFEEEVRQTFPLGSGAIDRTATAEYRARGTGEVVGIRVFELNDDELQPQLERRMQWWRGERPAEGVPIEEAYKCRFCDFANSCTWRRSMDESILGRARAKLEAERLKATATT